MVRLSVITPVYQVENYLKKCISSITHQSFKDLELVLIDDGSYDSGARFCDEYAADDERLIVIHQPNHGVSFARNRGLDIASGEWLSFIDSDDFLRPDAYNIIFPEIARTKSDMAIMEFAYVDADDNIVKPREYGENIVLTQKELIDKQFDIPLTIRCAMSNKVVRRSVLGELRFEKELRASEDTLLLSQCLLRVKKACWVRQPLYRNVQRKGSAMHGGLSLESVVCSLDIHKRIAEEIRVRFPDLYGRAYAYYLDTLVWKMNQATDPTACLPEEAKKRRKARKQICRRLLRETTGILKCDALTLKYKLSYILIGLKG